MDESITRHLDQPAKTLKLSEAIRIGSRIRPQAIGRYFLNGGSCALGAAAEAVRLDGEFCIANIRRRFELPYSIIRMVLMWNDWDRMPREKIADELEKIGY